MSPFFLLLRIYQGIHIPYDNMGILGLSKILHEKCPGAIKEGDMKHYFGRKIAIDASMSIYQFIIAMKGFEEGQGVELTNENGEVTSHLNGLFARTIRMVEEGLKPIYVFDGTPPEMKQALLSERRSKADDASKKLEEAKEAGDDELMEKMSKRTVRVSKEQTAECRKLLQLMGIPVVQAPGEAEAQCAELVRGGSAWAVGTEDMDALTFGSKILLRHLNYSDSNSKDAKRRILEIHLDQVLAQTGLTMDMFIDLCILLGCDYCPKILGIGGVKAWEGILAHKSIEGILANIDDSKYKVPEGWDFAGARALFKAPDVVPCSELNIAFTEPDAEGLIQFLCKEKLFRLERVERGIQRLRGALQKKTQGRLDQFFTVIPKAPKPAELPQAKKANPLGAKRPGGSIGSEYLPAGKLHKSEVKGAKKAVKK